MTIPDPSDSQSEVETEPDQKITSSQHSVCKEVRFWVSVLIGLALMIGYKAMFPTQKPVVDICIVILASLLIAFVSGFSIRQTIIGLLQTLLSR